ncbi:MAG TPA: ATPase, partial [Bacilli bacterium]|nr:ATPase [Bacilli bacterium]
FVKNNNSSKREEIKALIKELKKTNPYLEANIFKSTHNVNLNTLMGYHNNVVTKTFLDEYDQK